MAKKKSTSKCANPTARTLAELRRRGYLAEKVEQRVPMGRGGATFSRDLYGLGDVLAVRPPLMNLFDGTPTPADRLLVQATSSANHVSRVRKALGEGAEKLGILLRAGVRFEVWSWSLKGAVGKRKRYELRTQELTEEDLRCPRSADG